LRRADKHAQGAYQHPENNKRKKHMQNDDERRNQNALAVQITHLLVDILHFKHYRRNTVLFRFEVEGNIQFYLSALLMNLMAEKLVFEALLGNGRINHFKLFNRRLFLADLFIIRDRNKNRAVFIKNGNIADIQLRALFENLVDIHRAHISAVLYDIINPVFEARPFMQAVENRIFHDQSGLILPDHDIENGYIQYGNKHV